uniref:Uncharacterized protein n=1 Tax=Anguilla anguilla TaxID=7936 RepID=A0A0E9RTR3_ANGAN
MLIKTLLFSKRITWCIVRFRIIQSQYS